MFVRKQEINNKENSFGKYTLQLLYQIQLNVQVTFL